MARDFSVINGYLAELWDLISHFDKLDEVYDWLDNHFEDPNHFTRFQAVKNQYKVVRDNAWRWLRDKNFEPQPHHELERGQDSTLDCPLHWEAEVRRLVREVEDATNDLRAADREAERQAGLAVAPKLYLINTSDT